jgi:cation:H+ antiporter
MDNRQVVEVFLTAAQSLFAVVLILQHSISVRSAIALFGLFAVQFIQQLIMEELAVPFDLETRLGFSILYVVLSVGILVMDRHRVAELPGIFRSVMPGGSGKEDSDAGSE